MLVCTLDDAVHAGWRRHAAARCSSSRCDRMNGSNVYRIVNSRRPKTWHPTALTATVAAVNLGKWTAEPAAVAVTAWLRACSLTLCKSLMRAGT